MDGIREFILYRNLDDSNLFSRFVALMAHTKKDCKKKEKMSKEFYKCLHELLAFAADYGFWGNLWQVYLTYLLVNHENPYSRACEIRGKAQGTLVEAAQHDFALLKEVFDFDLSMFEEAYGVFGVEMIADFKGDLSSAKMLNQRMIKRILALSLQLKEAEDETAFLHAVTQFYQVFGTGKIGLHKAFRIEHTKKGAVIVPITNIADVRLNDLTGYEFAKKKLMDNTDAFVKGKKANNCLLFGDAGTGKSTSIKAVANQYYENGLRIIELYKHQFQDLHDVIAQIKNRNYKFIIYMDDLSFEDFEIEYKYLKAVIEGGLEKKPDNILIYATSNRRHLIRENFSDKPSLSDDLHNNDTVQEKLSLAARFGVQIYFGAPDKKQYGQIVTALAKKHQISMEEEELLAQVGKWELSHGGRSGRTAQQFIDHLLGKEGCE